MPTDRRIYRQKSAVFFKKRGDPVSCVLYPLYYDFSYFRIQNSHTMIDAKKYLSEMLGYFKYKVDNDQCTLEEIESVAKAISENIVSYGTIQDLSKFYGKSPDAVKSVIKNKMIAKPKRNVVLYCVNIFAKLVPKWHRNNTESPY